MTTDDKTDPRGGQRNRPSHVDALASTVISMLRDRQSVSTDGLRQFVLEHLVRAILVRGAFYADNVLEELRGHRVSLDCLIDDYVPAAARVVGTRWEEDLVSFADVTIATLRLQALLGEASISSQPDLPGGTDKLNALMLVPQNEQHFLGASVVAAQLRRIGCEVAQSFDEDQGSLAVRLMQDPPDLVLITCARRETLETAAKTITTIRNSLSGGPVIALGGAFRCEEQDVKEKTGADIVTCDASEAVRFCMKQRKARGSP